MVQFTPQKYPLNPFYINFMRISHQVKTWATILFKSSQNSANFDMWTISVAPVLPEIPPPPTQISQWICTVLTDHLVGLQNPRNCADPRKSLTPVKGCECSIKAPWFGAKKCVFKEHKLIVQPEKLLTSLSSESTQMGSEHHGQYRDYVRVYRMTSFLWKLPPKHKDDQKKSCFPWKHWN